MKRFLERLGRGFASEFLTPNEAKFVRWYDILWLIIPIAGIAMFVAVVERKTA